MIVNKVSKTATAVWYALSGTRKRARLVLKSALVMAFAQSVSAAVLFSDDYSEFNQEDYIIGEGDWTVSNSTLLKVEASGSGSINTGDAQWGDYTTSARLRTIEAGENWEVARLAVRVSGDGYYEAYLKRDGKLVFKSRINGQTTVLFTASTTVDPLYWHTLSIALQGSSIAVGVNGEVVESITNTDHSAGGVTLSSHVKARFDDLLVVSDATPPPGDDITGLNSFFMGHSFFIPVSALLPEQTEIAGLTDHSQQTYFSGGQTGTPDNLWLDPTNKAAVQAILDGGGIEQFGMVIAYDEVIDSYVKWIDYALQSNPLRSVFIGFPWATYPEDNLYPYDQFQDGHRNGLHPQIDTLRSLYPDLDIFCLPYGLTGYELEDLFYSGDLPEISQYTGPEETSIRTDAKGHGGTMLKKFSALMWLGSLYHVDLNEHDFETGYPSTNLKQMAMDLIDEHDPEYRATSTSTPTQLEMLVTDVNAGFNNVAVEVIEWPSELHNQLGAMFEFAYLTRPVESTSGKLPLVIALHGGGGNWWEKSLEERLEVSAEIDKKQGFDLAELAGKELIMLEPNTTADWTADELDTMLDYVLENFPDVDPDRVYVTGYSKGGTGTWVWLNESADRFAAAAIGGASGSQIDDVTKLANLPLWLIVGGDDGPATGTQNMVNNLSAAGNVNVEFTVIEGGDHSAAGDAYFSSVELVDFLLGFELPSQN